MYTVIGVFLGLILSVFIFGTLFLIWPRKGKLGINTDTVFCPDCDEKMPKARTPRKINQFLWGGWICPKCGAELDKYGVKIK